MEPREIHEGEEILVKGSAKEPYRVRMIDGLVSCTCPAWRNAQGISYEQGGRVRICKHIRAVVVLSSIPVLDQSSMEKIDWGSLPPVQTDSGLYRIVCSANGRFYIGSTDSFKRRWREHRQRLKRGKHHNLHLQEDYNALGEEAFRFYPYRDIADGDDRCAAETADIRVHLGADCYSQSEYAPPGMRGRKHSEKTRSRFREIHGTPEARAKRSAMNSRPEIRARNIAAHLGRKATADTRAKISAARKGLKVSPEALVRIRSRDRKATAETKAKISAAQIGKKHSSKARTKMSASQQARWDAVSAEDRVRIGAARTGETRSAEARARMSAAAQARWARPDSAEHRAQTSARCKGKTLSVEHRAKIGAKARLPENRAKSSATAKAQNAVRERTALGTFRPQKDKT